MTSCESRWVGPFAVATKIDKALKPFIMKGAFRINADADEFDPTADIPLHAENQDARLALNDLDPFHNVSPAEDEEPSPDALLGDDDEEGENGGGDDGADPGHEPDDEVRTPRAQFSAMSIREQDRVIMEMKRLAGRAYCVDVRDLELPDWFVLDCIEDGMSDMQFLEAARAFYRAYKPIVLTAEDRTLVARVSEMKDNWWFDDIRYCLNREAPIDARQPQTGGEKGEENIGRRFPHMGAWFSDINRRERGSRLRKVNGKAEEGKSNQPVAHPGSKSQGGRHESHCPKYGRQDYRHQLPRREAKAERMLAQYEAEWREYTCAQEAERALEEEWRQATHFFDDWSDHYYFRPGFEFSDDALNEALYESWYLVSFGVYPRRMDRFDTSWLEDTVGRDEEFTRFLLRGEREPERGWNPPWERRRPRPMLSFDYDPYDDYLDYLFNDVCDCPTCRGEIDDDDWDPRDDDGEEARRDTFEDYNGPDNPDSPSEAPSFYNFLGLTDVEVDALVFGQASSRLRLNQRLRAKNRRT